MRVLHVSAYYAPAFVYGGPPRSIHGLCRALRARGVDAEVFTTDANGADTLPPHVVSQGEYEGVPVRYFPRSWPAEPIGSRALSAALGEAVPAVDLVHVHGLWNRVVWAAAREARRCGVPYVLSPRGMLEDAALAHKAWRKRVAYAVIERSTVAGAALLHATSEGEAASLRARFPGTLVTLIPNGVNVEPSAPPRDRRSLGLPEDVPIILFLGRLHPIKRLDLLVDGFARLLAQRTRAHLVIAGPDEYALRAGLEAQVPELHDSISWMGEVDAPVKQGLLAHASALVLCSDSESFGMSVAEAMGAGVPVVVTRTCPWSDVARHDAGFWVDQSADAIAEALARLIADPVAARGMGERGRSLIDARYRWDAVAAVMTERYLTVVAGAPLAAPVGATS